MATPVVFFKEVQDELKKVVWPTRNEVTRLTFVVIFVSLVVGFFLGAVDLILAKIMQVVIR